MSAEDRKRIEALKIPPAWTKVAVSTSPRARLRAVGMDAAGRWQYVYDEAYSKHQERKKF